MKIPLNFGGGGGSGSDDCTATASDVLESKTAIYDGSDDEAEYGTMKDYSGSTNSATITNDSSNSRVTLTIPNTGKYDTTAKLYTSYSNLASAINLTASKIVIGNTILGIAGTYTGLGNATQAQVLSSKTFSTASLSNATGTMTDKSGTSTSATSSVSGSNYRLLVPTAGYYNTNAYLTNSYSDTASLIGLTAAKIKSGESILGITGTWSGYVVASTDLYCYGSVGSIGGSATTLNSTAAESSSADLDTSCITIAQKTNTENARYIGVVFNTAISTSSYNKLTMTYSLARIPTTSNPITWVGVYSTKPSGSTSLNPTNSGCAAYASETLSHLSTNTVYTLSVDLSSSTASRYVAVGCYTSAVSNGAFSVNITRIQLS